MLFYNLQPSGRQSLALVFLYLNIEINAGLRIPFHFLCDGTADLVSQLLV